MSSPPALPALTSSLSSPTALSSVETASAKQLALQTAVYLLIALVIVAIICGTIMLMWNDDWAVIRRHLKMQSFPLVSTSLTLVQMMLRYFPITLLPAFWRLPRTAAVSQLRPALPLFTAPGLLEPQRAALRPAMPHDGSVSLNWYPGSDSSNPSA